MLRLSSASNSSLASPSVYLMDDHDKAYELWKSLNVKNQILLHFDAHIDFEWIADKSPAEVIRQSSWPEALKELRSSYGWSFSNAQNRNLHLGNYIERALKDGMIKAWYWIVPDPIWNDPQLRQRIWKDLLSYHRFRTGPMEPPIREPNCFKSSFYGASFTACPISFLPEITEPVLLNIDVDFLTPCGFKSILDPESLYRAQPWLWPDNFFKVLEKAGVTPSVATVSNSVQGSFTPIHFKFFGESMRIRLEDGFFPNEYYALKNYFSSLTADKDSASFLAENSFDGVFEATRLFFLAKSALAKNDLVSARQFFEGACESDSEFTSPYNSFALYYENLGTLDFARQEHARVRLLNPSQLSARIAESDDLVTEKKFLAAETLLQSLLSEQSNCAPALIRMARLRRAEDKLNESSEYFQRYLKNNPDDSSALIQYGEVLSLQGELQEARTVLRSALGAGAHYPKTYSLLAAVYCRLGYFKKGLGLFVKAIRLRIQHWFALRFNQ